MSRITFFLVVGPKTIDCLFIGYAINSSAYRFLVHKYEIPDIHVNTIIESRNASLFENVFPSKNSCDGSSLKRTHDTATSDIDHESINDESEKALRRSKRERTSKSFGPDFLTYLLENKPQIFNEAMSTPEAPMWKEAINSELNRSCKITPGSWLIFFQGVNHWGVNGFSRGK